MYKIKLTPYRKDMGTIYHRQTPNYNLTSRDGKYQFQIGENIKEADFWVVQGKGIRQDETCCVAPENTIFLSTEPRSVLVYPQKYLNQFGLVCTCQENTKHPNVHYGPAILPWHVGFSAKEEGGYNFNKDYDGLKNAPTPDKKKLISVITSSKAFTAGHIKRLAFVEKLKQHYGDQLDVFGRGINDFEDKWDVLAPYKYHIAIENSTQPYYWTEKISDCFLTETYPFYYGCTNLSDYFPKESFIQIDINDIEKSIQSIDKAIEDNIYEQNLHTLSRCKNMVLEEYNMFEYIAQLCDKLNPDLPKENVTLHPCHSMTDIHNFCNYTFVRNYYKIRQNIKELFQGNIIDKLK